MRRRDFISLIGGAAATWPLAARAQPMMPIVGFLSSRSPVESTELVAGFRKGLRQIGFVEGQNAVIAFRWAEGHYERLPALASLISSICASPQSLRQGEIHQHSRLKPQPQLFQSFFWQRSSSYGFGDQPEPAGRQCHRHQ